MSVASVIIFGLIGAGIGYLFYLSTKSSGYWINVIIVVTLSLMFFLEVGNITPASDTGKLEIIFLLSYFIVLAISPLDE